MTGSGEGGQTTLRQRSALFAFVCAALLCFTGVVVVAREFGSLDSGLQQERLLPAVVLLAALAGIGLLAVAKLRTRVILDADGVTMVGTWGRNRLQWSQVTRWEVEPRPRRWLVRAWCDDDSSYIVYRHVVLGFHGLAIFTGDTYPQPPQTAPGCVHTAYGVLTEYWRAGRSA